jgi:hypothetical protein
MMFRTFSQTLLIKSTSLDESACLILQIEPIGGRDQEDHSLKPTQANSSQDPISKKLITKKSWWSGSRFRLWVQTPAPQKQTNKQKDEYSFPHWAFKTFSDWNIEKEWLLGYISSNNNQIHILAHDDN